MCGAGLERLLEHGRTEAVQKACAVRTASLGAGRSVGSRDFTEVLEGRDCGWWGVRGRGSS